MRGLFEFTGLLPIRFRIDLVVYRHFCISLKKNTEAIQVNVWVQVIGLNFKITQKTTHLLRTFTSRLRVCSKDQAFDICKHQEW